MEDTKLIEMPFPAVQRIFNRLYYQRGGKYSRDFETSTSTGTALPFAEADDFYSHLSTLAASSSLPSSIRILELGPGNGNGAARFLNRLMALDKKNGTKFYARVKYVLADFSRQMLDAAFKNKLLHRHMKKLSFTHCDAENLKFEEGNFLLVRANELLDDLPTQILTREGTTFYEVSLAMHLDGKLPIPRIGSGQIPRREFARLAAQNSTALSKIDGKFLKHVSLEVMHTKAHPDITSALFVVESFKDFPEDFLIPIPIAASSTIISLKSLLAPHGRIDFFDYGFSTMEELEKLQSAIFRTPGALTTFVNFPYLLRLATLAGFSTASLAPQSKFAPKARKIEHHYHLRLER